MITCLIFIKGMGSVGIGTVIAAVLVGTELGIISKLFEKRKKKTVGGKGAAS